MTNLPHTESKKPHLGKQAHRNLQMSLILFFALFSPFLGLFLPWLKNFSSSLNSGRTMAQVPCLSHSCCQKSNLPEFLCTLVQWLSNSLRMPLILLGSKGRSLRQWNGPLVWLLVGQIPWTVHDLLLSKSYKGWIESLVKLLATEFYLINKGL